MLYTRAEVLSATTEYFNGDVLPAKSFTEKYALYKDDMFLELDPEDMHWRLATEFARADAAYPDAMEREKFFEFLQGFNRFVPGGSIMSGLGNAESLSSLGNCFAVPGPEDSITGIGLKATELMNISKRRGGTGFELSTLRPDGARVSNSAKTSSGAASWGKYFAAAGDCIGQNGRRAAFIFIFDVKHPDIEKFITCKQDIKDISAANISVKITDDFMAAVKADADWDLVWKDQIYGTVKATKLWDMIAQAAWKTGEPGMIFWENYAKTVPLHYYPGMECVSPNPCGELLLAAYESCKIGSINLKTFIRDKFTAWASFDWALFKETIRMAIRMMDNLVDLETEALAKIIAACTDDFERDLFIKIRDVAIAARRIGLGTHGLADALACLQIKYDSEEGLAMAEGIFDVLRDESYRASIELAKVRGAFPLYNYQTDQQCAFIKSLPSDIQEDMKKYGRRNGALLTSAPTGTISILCQTSSGAEPVFANFYYRSKKINDPNQEADFIDANGVKWEQYKVRHHNVQDFLSLYPEFTDETLPEWFVTSADINWDYRLRMQKTIGDRSDGGVSSTLNLPTETSWETIRDIYMKAYDYGIKGVTVYRDGCRDGVLNITDKHSEEFYKRPEVLKCDIYHVTVKELIDEVTVPVPYVVIISLKEGKPFEIFGGKADGELLAKKQKQGEITKHKHRKTNRYELVSNGTTICDLGESFNASTYSVGNRLMSLALRNSCGVNFLIDQLLSEPDSDMNAYNRVVSRCLKNYVEDGAKSGVTCPQCGAKALRYQDKCSICMDCGFSGCS